MMPRVGVLRLLLLAVLVVMGASRASAGSAALPIYFEESHAGSFHWLAQRLDLETAHTLVHFDAHSDASAVLGSDEIRSLIRRVVSADERAERLARWRQLGAIQCFDWIEPLMPAPFARVIWVPAEKLSRGEMLHREKIAREALDTHQEALPRETGPLASRYGVRSFETLRQTWRDDGTPLVVSIDLDCLATVPAERQAEVFERIWDWTTRRPGLRAVTLALSRPWLRDDAEAHRLAEIALRGALTLPAAAIHFEPFQQAGPDRSERAKQLRAKGQVPPTWKVEEAPESLRALLLAARARLRVGHETSRWQSLLERWAEAAPVPAVELRGRAPDVDGVWRVPVTEEAILQLAGGEAAATVDWFALMPLHPSCNLFARDGNWSGFATGAPPRPRWREQLLGQGSTLDLAAARACFDAATGCGSVRILARLRAADGCIRESWPSEVRRFAGEGLRAALTEQFALPYLLGGSILSDGPRTGPETGWGADCANFLVAALRRTGRLIPWCDPKQLREHLHLLAARTRLDESKFSAEQAASGLVIHLGSHVAALVEDRPPLGVLNADDLVVHQLEGPPEQLALGALLRRRKTEVFDLYTAADPPGERVLIGGDVMLGRNIGLRLERGEDVFAGLAPTFRTAAAVAVNLECVPARAGEPVLGRRYHLRAPVAAAKALQSAGIALVGLANNHADDFGDAGLEEALAHLQAAGVRVSGAGPTADEAHAPGVLALPDGTRVAFLALTDVPVALPGLVRLHLATATDRVRLGEVIHRARQEADVIIALVHWGLEGAAEPSEAQHELARWLAAQGVQAIAGAHPHRLQSLEVLHGVPIAFSLGNLVFDGAPAVPWWNAGALLELTIGPNRRIGRARLVPVTLDEGGVPTTKR